MKQRTTILFVLLTLILTTPVPASAGWFDFLEPSTTSTNPEFTSVINKVKAARKSAERLGAKKQFPYHFKESNRKLKDLEEHSPASLPSAEPIERGYDLSLSFYRLAVRSAELQLQNQPSPSPHSGVDSGTLQKLSNRVKKLEESLQDDASDTKSSKKSKSKPPESSGDSTIFSDSMSVSSKESADTAVQADSNSRQSTIDSLQKTINNLRTLLEKKKKRMKKMIQTNDQIMQENKKIKEQLETIRQGTVRIRNRRVYLTLDDSLLFELGTAELKPSMKSNLEMVADVIRSVDNRTVFVEGHTDDIPLTDEHPMRDNWELSAQRALSVLNQLEEYDVESARLRIFAAGAYDTKVANTSASHRAKNRRVEVAFVPNVIQEEVSVSSDTIPMIDTGVFARWGDQSGLSKRIDFEFSGSLTEAVRTLSEKAGFDFHDQTTRPFSKSIHIHTDDTRVGRILESIGRYRDGNGYLIRIHRDRSIVQLISLNMVQQSQPMMDL